MAKKIRKTTKKFSSKVILFIAMLIILGVCLIGVNLFINMKEERLLTSEISSINKLLNKQKFDEKQMNKKLNTYVTNGEYQTIEKAYKNYLKDNQKTVDEIKEYFKNDKVSSLLTIDNIKKDGKEFKTSLETIKKSREQLTNLKNKFNQQADEKYVMKYLDKKDLSDYYITFYKNQIARNITESKGEKELKKQIDINLELINKVEKVINYLVKNSKYWNADGNVIYFETDELTNKYNKLLKDIQKS